MSAVLCLYCGDEGGGWVRTGVTDWEWEPCANCPPGPWPDGPGFPPPDPNDRQVWRYINSMEQMVWFFQFASIGFKSYRRNEAEALATWSEYRAELDRS